MSDKFVQGIIRNKLARVAHECRIPVSRGGSSKYLMLYIFSKVIPFSLNQ
jgi:hypothetical protein